MGPTAAQSWRRELSEKLSTESVARLAAEQRPRQGGRNRPQKRFPPTQFPVREPISNLFAASESSLPALSNEPSTESVAGRTAEPAPKM